jgi:hypothetical protein
MQAVLDWLNGKKTYIVAILLAVFDIGVAVGWWPVDSAVWQSVNAILAAFGLAFLRAGVAKSGPAQ